MTKPRGIRNNNPGNIDFNPRNEWLGQSGIEDGAGARFATFSSAVYGIRAIARLLITYQERHKLLTVYQILNRYAPAKENDTGSYINAVATKLGVSQHDRISVRNKDVMFDLVSAIIKHENGIQPYSDTVINEALKLAGVK